jgi:hypothetical protein
MIDAPNIQNEIIAEQRGAVAALQRSLQNRWHPEVSCTMHVEANFKTFVIVDGVCIGAVNWSVSDGGAQKQTGWEPGPMPGGFQNILKRENSVSIPK